MNAAVLFFCSQVFLWLVRRFKKKKIHKKQTKIVENNILSPALLLSPAPKENKRS